MTAEQLVLLAVFLLIPLLNFLARALWRRLQRPTPSPLEPEPGRRPEPPPRVRMRPAPTSRLSERPHEAPPPAPAPARRRSRAQLGPADLRRGIVLMAILAPCGGMEPPATPR